MKFRIVVDHRNAFSKSGAKDLSKLGFKFIHDKKYKKSWWLDLDNNSDVFVDFKKAEDIVNFFKKYGATYLEVDNEIPQITI